MSNLEKLKERVEAARQRYAELRGELRDALREDIAVRICCKCCKQIRSGHKWKFVEKKNGSMVQHRLCDYPSYYTVKSAKYWEGKGFKP